LALLAEPSREVNANIKAKQIQAAFAGQDGQRERKGGKIRKTETPIRPSHYLDSLGFTWITDGNRENFPVKSISINALMVKKAHLSGKM
jgi:hypothetical protein